MMIYENPTIRITRFAESVRAAEGQLMEITSGDINEATKTLEERFNEAAAGGVSRILVYKWE